MRFIFSEIDDQMIPVYQGGGKAWQCVQCSYTTKNKTHMTEHIDAKHITRAGLPCMYCLKICPNVKSLKNHVYNQHKEKKLMLC